jgi:sugar phosphate isomerase/epimerase
VSDRDLELCCMSMRRANLVELADAAAGVGYRYITTTTWLFDDAPLTGADLRRRIDDAGVQVSMIDGLTSALPGAPSAGPERRSFEECAEIAHLLGARCLNLVHIGGVPTPTDELGDAFAKVCEKAAAEGLRLVIEFLPGTGIPDLKTGLAVVRHANQPNGKLLFDTWHHARCGGTPPEIDAEAARWIGALQLSDRTLDQDLVPYVPMTGRKIPGRGALPLARWVAPILAAHPGMPVGVEILSDEMEAMDFDEAAGTAATALRDVIAEADGLLARS